MATAKAVLESAIDALTRRTLGSEPAPQAESRDFSGAGLRFAAWEPEMLVRSSASVLSRRGLVSINGTWLSERLCCRIGSAS